MGIKHVIVCLIAILTFTGCSSQKAIDNGTVSAIVAAHKTIKHEPLMFADKGKVKVVIVKNEDINGDGKIERIEYENHEIYYWFHVETQMSIPPHVATNITMEDKKQAEQVIRDYLNYIDKHNYEEAWKLLAPQDRASQTQESFMVVHQGVKAIKLTSIKGYSLVPCDSGNTIVYDEKVPTVAFHLVLDVVPLEGSAWGEGRNERFVVGRKGLDGKWLVSGFASSP